MFLLCTAIWAASGAEGSFWPIWVALFALIPLLGTVGGSTVQRPSSTASKRTWPVAATAPAATSAGSVAATGRRAPLRLTARGSESWINAMGATAPDPSLTERGQLLEALLRALRVADQMRAVEAVDKALKLGGRSTTFAFT